MNEEVIAQGIKTELKEIRLSDLPINFEISAERLKISTPNPGSHYKRFFIDKFFILKFKNSSYLAEKIKEDYRSLRWDLIYKLTLFLEDV